MTDHKPEPVAFFNGSGFVETKGLKDYVGFLYTAPPKREWVGLTEEEAWEMLRQMSLGASVEDVRFVEAKLKEKNT